MNISDTLPIIPKIAEYLYTNITLPRVSPEYTPKSILPSIPSRNDILIRVWEILASVHPNYYAISLVFSCVAIFCYIKIRYPFWNTQPVVHTYDYLRKWFYTTPVILFKNPFKTRFYDPKQVVTRDYQRLSTDDIKSVCEFLNAHYIPTDRLLSTITEKTLSLYLSGHNASSYISIHREIDGTITGACASRLSCFYWYSSYTSTIASDGKSSPEYFTPLEMYWLDFVTIRRNFNQTHIAERLLQTHEYNIRIMNPKIAVSMFKKEGDLCECVVPFVEYTTSTFYMRNVKVDPLPPDFILSRVTKTNLDILHDIYHILTHPGDGVRKMMAGCILPDIGHIQSLIISSQMYLFCLKKKGHIYGIYWFKDMNIHYEDLDGKTLGLVASFQNTESPDIFMVGFTHSLRQILLETPDYRILSIYDIGHTTTLLSNWRVYNHTILETPCALYFYNYMVPNIPILSRDLFIL